MIKYTILTLNDDRKQYKDIIRARAGYEEVYVPAVNGKEINVEYELAKRRLHINDAVFKRGELGIWLSNFDCWNYAAKNSVHLIVFEDDAIPDNQFQKALDFYFPQIPEDYDFMSLWVPDNQRQDFHYNVKYDTNGIPTISGRVPRGAPSLFEIGNEYIARAYQGYGGVATMYSPKGGRRLVEVVRERGLWTPSDCFLFQEAHAGRVEGYTLKPKYASLVTYDWKATTTIHHTEKYYAD